MATKKPAPKKAGKPAPKKAVAKKPAAQKTVKKPVDIFHEQHIFIVDVSLQVKCDTSRPA